MRDQHTTYFFGGPKNNQMIAYPGTEPHLVLYFRGQGDSGLLRPNLPVRPVEEVLIQYRLLDPTTTRRVFVSTGVVEPGVFVYLFEPQK